MFGLRRSHCCSGLFSIRTKCPYPDFILFSTGFVLFEDGLLVSTGDRPFSAVSVGPVVGTVLHPCLSCCPLLRTDFFSFFFNEEVLLLNHNSLWSGFSKAYLICELTTCLKKKSCEKLRFSIVRFSHFWYQQRNNLIYLVLAFKADPQRLTDPGPGFLEVLV